MSRNRKKNKAGKILCILIVIVVIAVVLKVVVFDTAKKKIASVVAEKMIEMELTNDDSAVAQDAEQIYSSMSEEDKDTINQLVEDKMDTKTISEVKDYVQSDDKEGLKTYIKEKFNDNEIDEMKTLYEKYK